MLNRELARLLKAEGWQRHTRWGTYGEVARICGLSVPKLVSLVKAGKVGTFMGSPNVVDAWRHRPCTASSSSSVRSR